MKAWKRNVAIALAAGAMTLCTAGTAFAKGDVEAGQEKAQVCTACHGATGNESTIPSYPRLAGQYASYLVRSLESYQNGERTNVVMQGFVANLTDEDIEDLAAYFASQEGLRDLKIK